ncbi:hypothetical protein QFZ37_000461 [Chryseobacterium ginsenosidimutans]|uniref:hypothetical protein n=1 Tax=Chryseobacterium ginsenosidimutans TaxID=687846 RepID=UPI00278A4AC6|nr:hypothetical protein [Chryseobacterium ginsenosidimutans]MDQ0592092.1 hypothetical protein [Chryseobacterium ginsenosidimutans]
METITNFKSKANNLLAMMFTIFASVITFAQDAEGVVTKENKTTTTTTTEWYTDPMYLIGGGVLLIIIIALIARSGKK